MEQTERFYDFCVPYNKDEKEMRAMLDELVDLGYKTIAIEQVYDHSKKSETKNEPNTKGKEIFPEPIDISALKAAYKNELKIFQRLTIIYTDLAIAHSWAQSLNLKKFNLLAGQPKSDEALNHCCSNFYGDIITFDPNAGLKLLIHRKSYLIAVSRGLFFEIKYSPAIADPNNRKDMIKLAFNYGIRGKSKNIIFSSGAKNAFEIRGPNDVVNLGFIFSLSTNQSKNAIDKNCRQLFLKAEARRLGKTIMKVKSRDALIAISDDTDSETTTDDENNEEVGDDDDDDGVVDDDDVDDKDDEDNVEEDVKNLTDTAAASESSNKTSIAKMSPKKRKKTIPSKSSQPHKKSKIIRLLK